MKSQCISDNPRTKKNHRFCCCTGNMCNANTTSIEAPEEYDNIPSTINEAAPVATTTSLLMSPIVLICVSFVVVIIIPLVLFLTCNKSTKSQPELAPLAPSGPGYSSNLHNVDNLKLCAMIGQGKYGTVWKGMINEQPVAVKIFPAQHKQYFINEKNIYSLNLMDCPSLLEYYGCDTRRTLNDSIEYLLVMSLAPLGCLQDWLIENTCSFATFSKMAKSITRGLAHLHTELKKDDFEKPCICHRDLNTRNILVNADLSCCISDFGFALKTYGPRYEWRGQITLAETKSINEVGTLRYMAPEVLEGAVNLRDCETALKQIDVYTLGLVLWELCTRCSDWYPTGQNPPPYQAPYEAEIGKNPSFEHMQVLVSRHKARPLFTSSWGGGPASKIAKETCEDCWDHDAEARLTALCVEERIHELAAIGPRSYTTNRGSSPPLSTNNLINSPIVTTCAQDPSSNLYQNNDTTIITPPNQITPNVNSDTCETIISLSSSGTVKNLAMFSHQIQAFQGRNPCLERNLAPQINQKQILIDKSKKHSFIENSEDNSLARLEDAVNVDQFIGNSTSNGVINSNIMGEGFPKQNNTESKLKGWYGVRALIQKKLFKHSFGIPNENDEKSNLVDSSNIVTINVSPKRNPRVSLVENGKFQNGFARKDIASSQRPSNLDLAPQLNVLVQNSNRHINLIKNITHSDDAHGFKKPPGDRSNQAFAIINQTPRIVVSKSANAVKNLNNLEAMDDKQLRRQRSLEIFNEVFGAKGSIERLRDPSQRIKTPGDVPPSVRKVRASKTLSLYDDRMMDTSTRYTL